MNKNPLDGISQVSRIIFVSSLLLAVVTAITKITIFIWVAAFLACISWITPGILILLNMPWLAQAWLRGINTIWIPAEPWEKLTDWKKFLIYFYSIVFSLSAVFAIASYINIWLE